MGRRGRDRAALARRVLTVAVFALIWLAAALLVLVLVVLLAIAGLVPPPS